MRLTLLICLLPLLAQATRQDSLIDKGNVAMGATKFSYKKILLANTDSTVVFELYRGDKKILTHPLFDQVADCDSRGITLGGFEISDTAITFYSYWAWEGGCCSNPYGARKQVYRLTSNGALLLATSQIYLQMYTHRLSAMSDAGAKTFIAKVEKEYNATFVLGKQADALIAETKQRLAKQIAVETTGWERNRFGYMR